MDFRKVTPDSITHQIMVVQSTQNHLFFTWAVIKHREDPAKNSSFKNIRFIMFLIQQLEINMTEQRKPDSS